MAYWDPFEEMKMMHEEMDRLFGNFFGPRALPPAEKSEQKELAMLPVTGINETEKEVIATFEIPGAKKEEIELNVNENSIEVKAEQKHEREEKGKDFYGYTKTSSSFYRKMPLPSAVKPAESKASYENGVLKVAMPKAHLENSRKKLEIE